MVPDSGGGGGMEGVVVGTNWYQNEGTNSVVRDVMLG